MSAAPARAPAPLDTFDTAALDAWLRQHLPGHEGIVGVERFSGGQSNPTYRLITPSRQWVMRTRPGPKARLLPSAHAIDREARVMRALAGSQVPVPEVAVLCDDEAVIGRAFYLMQMVEGRIFWEPALPGLLAAERAAIFDEMNRVIAALHRVRVDDVGLADYGRPGNYFARQIERWSTQYRASATQPMPAMDALIDWLPAHIPEGARDAAERAIVHGDFRLDNLIFDAHEWRVKAVLDWELSTLGHPLADLSYHCMIWHIGPALFRGIGGLDLPGLGIPGEHAYVSRYCERTGRADADAVLTDWNFYLAYNLFRMAAILQGIARRALDGTAASADAVATGAKAGPLAELGWRLAREGGAYEYPQADDIRRPPPEGDEETSGGRAFPQEPHRAG